MKMIVSHPTSNEFNRSALSGFLDSQMLGEFHTSVASFPGSFLDRIGGFAPFSQVRRRSFQPELRPYTSSFPFLELGRIWAGKFKMKSFLEHEKGLFCLDSVYRELDQRVGTRLKKASAKGVKGIYAYEDGALYSFRKAKSLGLTCIYDLPIGYWRTARHLLQHEQKSWPEWSSTLTGFSDSYEKLKRKDEELALADRIFVASTFTAKTLKDYPGQLSPVEIIPYGFPPVTTLPKYDSLHKGRRLKLLFVGGLSQRKGIANLFSAVEKFKHHVELTVVGYKAVPDCTALNAALSKHTWIPTLPHEKVLNLMKEQDVLVFPSLFEGFGMVITEAMSQGTPVITTDRTAGPDIINHGENGWLIEAGSTMALETVIEELVRNPEQIAQVGRAAIATARSRPWKVYGRELAEAISKASKKAQI